jgi:hypothetical protein
MMKKKVRRFRPSLEALECRCVPALVWHPTVANANWENAGNWTINGGGPADHWPGQNGTGDIAAFNNSNTNNCVLDGSPPNVVALSMSSNYTGTLKLEHDLTVTSSSANFSLLAGGNIDLGAGQDGSNNNGGNLIVNAPVGSALVSLAWNGTNFPATNAGTGQPGSLKLQDGALVTTSSDTDMTFAGKQITVGQAGSVKAEFDMGFQGAWDSLGMKGNINLTGASLTYQIYISSNGYLKMYNDNGTGTNGGSFLDPGNKGYEFYDGGTIERNGKGQVEMDGQVTIGDLGKSTPPGVLNMATGTLYVHLNSYFAAADYSVRVFGEIDFTTATSTDSAVLKVDKAGVVVYGALRVYSTDNGGVFAEINGKVMEDATGFIKMGVANGGYATGLTIDSTCVLNGEIDMYIDGHGSDTTDYDNITVKASLTFGNSSKVEVTARNAPNHPATGNYYDMFTVTTGNTITDMGVNVVLPTNWSWQYDRTKNNLEVW